MDKKKRDDLSCIIKHLIIVHGERIERVIREGDDLGLLKEIDGFLFSLGELRISLTDFSNDCGNPNCPIHGTASRAACATDPGLN